MAEEINTMVEICRIARLIGAVQSLHRMREYGIPQSATWGDDLLPLADEADEALARLQQAHSALVWERAGR